MSDPQNTIALIASMILVIVGLIGTVVPGIPGTILIFLGALLYGFLEGFQAVGWPTLVVLGLLTVVATTADVWATSVGARLGGASGWSIVGGMVGGLVGLIVFTLPGAIIGALVGVLAVEILRARDWRQALKASGGWAVGWILATALQAGIGLVMAVIFVWQVMRGPSG
ncbi:MAG: DUF456 domain-containing protein [Anaerolineae bacterium]|jgi:uncharacterized protein YqgC (DUF456 family)|nr:DUF456 domain-containing protein [Anaerolineae bacterium]MDX9830014.1 DUF456 domain-containing protein [Anaerolineae bacterium]